MWYLLYVFYLLASPASVASYDHRTIGDGGKVRHFIKWCIVAAVTTVVASAVVWLGNYPWWSLAPMLLGGAAWFASEHRLLLNKFRPQPWWYMGPSLDIRKPWDSIIDAMWHWIAWFVSGRVQQHRFRTGEWVNIYPADLPGELAFIAEAVAYLGCALWIILGS